MILCNLDVDVPFENVKVFLAAVRDELLCIASSPAHM